MASCASRRVSSAAFPITSAINVAKVPEEVRHGVRSALQRGAVANGGDHHVSAAAGRRASCRGTVPIARKRRQGDPLRDDALDERTALDAFARSYPHPADLTRRYPAERPERDAARDFRLLPAERRSPQRRPGDAGPHSRPAHRRRRTAVDGGRRPRRLSQGPRRTVGGTARRPTATSRYFSARPWRG